MQLTIKNQINLDDQTELIKQVYTVEVTEKNHQLYLIYTNEENEKVIIKCSKNEMLMTRYSLPKSIMRFHRDSPALVTIPTPLGLQQLVTVTQKFYTDFEKQMIAIDYQLRQLETEALFAEYQLELSWQ